MIMMTIIIIMMVAIVTLIIIITMINYVKPESREKNGFHQTKKLKKEKNLPTRQQEWENES